MFKHIIKPILILTVLLIVEFAVRQNKSKINTLFLRNIQKEILNSYIKTTF
jgi:hypothetical protein